MHLKKRISKNKGVRSFCFVVVVLLHSRPSWSLFIIPSGKLRQCRSFVRRKKISSLCTNATLIAIKAKPDEEKSVVAEKTAVARKRNLKICI